MDQVNTLRRYGLFDAKVPRYTSYPPANRFEPDLGAQVQTDWLDQVGSDNPLSVYIHIPFCRRLCWFCACRTQGTKTLGPVESYVHVVMKEIETIATRHLASGVKMRRLHLGGGTPTLLSGPLMSMLLDHIHKHFTATDDFEFSVEIDPTEAAPDVLKTLSDFNMARASVGVQDFAPRVQKAIGRMQSFQETRNIIDVLRQGGVTSLNIDFLYGLPFQTPSSLIDTLDRVVALQPDRLALYGYAHVPHMSKRQVMIPDETLPDAETRFTMAQTAKDRLTDLGYRSLGIDHFALPQDSLSQAADRGEMTRNFQGYTDDPCDTLIGFGASSISKYRQGYAQNAVATSAYIQRIEETGLAAHKGISLSDHDMFIAALIDGLMCQAEIRFTAIANRYPERAVYLQSIADDLMEYYPDLLTRDDDCVRIRPQFIAAARLIAAHLDKTRRDTQIHSLAV